MISAHVCLWTEHSHRKNLCMRLCRCCFCDFAISFYALTKTKRKKKECEHDWAELILLLAVEFLLTTHVVMFQITFRTRIHYRVLWSYCGFWHFFVLFFDPAVLKRCFCCCFILSAMIKWFCAKRKMNCEIPSKMKWMKHKSDAQKKWNQKQFVIVVKYAFSVLALFHFIQINYDNIFAAGFFRECVCMFGHINKCCRRASNQTK